MLRSKVRATLLAALLVVPHSAMAEPAPRELWSQATAATDSGDYKSGEGRVQELLDNGKSLGIRRYPLFADSALSLARQSSAQGNKEASQWALKSAQRLDPYSPNVAFNAADLAKQNGDWGGAIGGVLRGFGRIASDYKSRTLSQSDMVMVLALALATLTALFAIAMLLRYSRSAAHDFREFFGQRFTPGITTVLAYALLLLPLFLWLSPMWLVLYWLALFFAYETKVEKGATITLLLITALLPPLLSWAAWRAAGVESPVVRAAAAAQERSYNPEVIRRLRELAEVVPDEPRLQLLMGNLLVQEGDEQQAALHYRKAIELSDRLAGAHVNLGNLHFLNNDFQAASTEYERAQTIDAKMTIAYYNASVAAGELYKYDQQGEKLAQAKKYDASLVDRIVANPPPQKVVQYNLPIGDAWALAEGISKQQKSRDVFGNFATFDPARSFVNTLTIGSLLALVGGLLSFSMRRKRGVAGACIKCGRTFCYRCKSSKESAIYCTQCIHIYLKRDGVSIDTKRAKLEEVQQYQSGTLTLRKWLSTFFPGSGQLLEGRTVSGIVILLLFALFVGSALLIGRMAPVAYPAETMRLLARSLAIFAAVIVWVLFTIPVYRQKVNG